MIRQPDEVKAFNDNIRGPFLIWTAALAIPMTVNSSDSDKSLYLGLPLGTALLIFFLLFCYAIYREFDKRRMLKHIIFACILPAITSFSLFAYNMLESWL